MVKTTKPSPANPDQNPNPTDLKFKGVRKRKWGKWVSEIRLPHSRDRIWLGSYDCPIKAARAFDAAQICLRGPSLANLNFPNNPPKLDGPTNGLSPAQIQLASATYANSEVSDSGNVDSTQDSGMSSTATVEEEVSDSGVRCESGYNESEGGAGPVLDYCDYEMLEILGLNSYPNIDSTQYSDMSSTVTVEEEAVLDSGVWCESSNESEGGPGPVLDYCDYETIKILGLGNFDESFGFGDFCGTQFSDCCEYDSLNGSGLEDLSLWSY